jgi:flagellar hook-associated protein 2
MYAARAPERLMAGQKVTLQAQDSAYSDLSSKLSDLQTKLNVLTQSTGIFTAQKATSSNTNIFTATADGTAQVGAYTVKVNALATASTFSSNAFTDSTTALGLSGTFNLAVGTGSPSTITVATTDNLTNIRDKINAAGLGLTASIITDTSGARLSIIGNNTGTANAVSISSNTVTGLTFTQNTAAANASVLVNGISISSATNTVTGAVAGVTLNLAGVDTTNTYNLTITTDTTAITGALNDFATAYNAVNSFINKQFAYDPNKKSQGPLGSDSVLREIQGKLQSVLTSTFSGNTTITTFRSAGLALQQDGSLTVDSTKLGPALSSNFNELKNFFQNASGPANLLNAKLNESTDIAVGSITTARNNIAATIRDIDSHISDIESQLVFRQQLLIAQFTRADTALKQLSVMQSQISSSLAGTG